jgi:lipoprotein signal peptidase
MNHSKKILILIPVIIIGLDLLTKILAYNLLPFHEHVFIYGDKISLYSTYNTDSSGGQADYLISKSGFGKNNVIFWGTINWILFSIYILLIDKLKSKSKKKWFLLIPLFILNLILLEICLKVFFNSVFSNHFISWFSKIGIVGFLGVLTYLTKEKWTKVFLICIISAGLGNIFSHFYPPYHIVDFISIKGSYELIRIGIFNIADSVFYLVLILLIIFELYQTIKRTTAHHKRS